MPCRSSAACCCQMWSFANLVSIPCFPASIGMPCPSSVLTTEPNGDIGAVSRLGCFGQTRFAQPCLAKESSSAFCRALGDSWVPSAAMKCLDPKVNVPVCGGSLKGTSHPPSRIPIFFMSHPSSPYFISVGLYTIYTRIICVF